MNRLSRWIVPSIIAFLLTSVSLCSNCHNEIHYGKNADKIITKLYEARKDKLLEGGIDITLDELLKKYYSISKKEM